MLHYFSANPQDRLPIIIGRVLQSQIMVNSQKLLSKIIDLILENKGNKLEMKGCSKKILQNMKPANLN